MKIPLPLILVLSAALVDGAINLNCNNPQSILDDNGVIFSYRRSPTNTLWFRRTGQESRGRWVPHFHFGKETDTVFEEKYEFQIKLTGAKYVNFKFLMGSKVLLDERVSRSWFNSGGWIGVTLKQSRLEIIFPTDDKQLLLQLSAKQLESVEAVKMFGQLDFTGSCSIPDGKTS
ncbi:hypothetical protein Hamer_G023416, partial [Homarus americanus]